MMHVEPRLQEINKRCYNIVSSLFANMKSSRPKQENFVSNGRELLRLTTSLGRIPGFGLTLERQGTLCLERA